MTNLKEINITRALIGLTFSSQMEAARQLHMHERTVRWWCQHGAPPHVVAALSRLSKEEISLRWARTLIRTRRTRRVNGARA